MTGRQRRHLFVPEVIQTSGMDCGPAALKCFLGGFGIDVSYGRLREICQTDIDGTSINTIEDAARALGLDARQIMVPHDHVLLPEAHALPAVAVVRHPNGNTHFVVVWNRIGPFVQVMDPGSGRRWKRVADFLAELYRHNFAVPAAAWRVWAGSEEFLAVLRSRIRALEISPTAPIAAALLDPTWKSIARLDAATRLTRTLVDALALRTGREAERVLLRALDPEHAIADEFWSVRGGVDTDTLLLAGAVLVRANGLLADKQEKQPAWRSDTTLTEGRREQPVRKMMRTLREDGLLDPLLLGITWVTTACALIAQALLFRGLFSIASRLVDRVQLLGGLAAVIALAVILLLERIPSAIAVYRYGRRLETKLRIALLLKIPRLGDRYFHSRLTADMAERSHNIHAVRSFAYLGSRVITSFLELVLTVVGIVWIDSSLALIAIVTGVAVLALPILIQPVVTEQDLRVRAHVGALGRLYFDAMVGMAAVRAHAAEGALRREQRSLIREWMAASRRLLRLSTAAEGLQTACATLGAAAMLVLHLRHTNDAGGALLLVYWSLNMPMLAGVFLDAMRRYPQSRNTTLRLLELLDAPDGEAAPSGDVADVRTGGAAIAMCGVSVRAAGNLILRDVDLQIEPGEHVAVIGESGAGKTTLLALLLGWHRPAAGTISVDGRAFDDSAIEALRSRIAWVDPSIQIWNDSLLNNLTYGGELASPDNLATTIEQARLLNVIQGLPHGLQTTLGEGGGLVSGGEGQRVRVGRAMLNRDARLVLLDEPFRGLDRTTRRELIEACRARWRNATLICVTHDVSETLGFDRVVVVEQGRVVEAASPQVLRSNPDSHYTRLLHSETVAREKLWGGAFWRRIRIEGGTLVEH